VSITFDVYEFDSWDADSVRWGDDYFTLTMTAGTNSDSFSFFMQASRTNDAASGTSVGGTITWSMTDGPRDRYGFAGHYDQFHYVEVTIPSSFFSDSFDLRLLFTFDMTAGISNESGGIDNLVIRACMP